LLSWSCSDTNGLRDPFPVPSTYWKKENWLPWRYLTQAVPFRRRTGKLDVTQWLLAVAKVFLIASIGVRTPRKAIGFSTKPQAEQGIPYDLVIDPMIPAGVIVRKPYLSSLPKEILHGRLKRFLLFQSRPRHPKIFGRTEFPTWKRSSVVFLAGSTSDQLWVDEFMIVGVSEGQQLSTCPGANRGVSSWIKVNPFPERTRCSLWVRVAHFHELSPCPWSHGRSGDWCYQYPSQTAFIPPTTWRSCWLRLEISRQKIHFTWNRVGASKFSHSPKRLERMLWGSNKIKSGKTSHPVR